MRSLAGSSAAGRRLRRRGGCSTRSLSKTSGGAPCCCSGEATSCRRRAGLLTRRVCVRVPARRLRNASTGLRCAQEHTQNTRANTHRSTGTRLRCSRWRRTPSWERRAPTRCRPTAEERVAQLRASLLKTRRGRSARAAGDTGDAARALPLPPARPPSALLAAGASSPPSYPCLAGIQAAGAPLQRKPPARKQGRGRAAVRFSEGCSH